MYRHHKESIKNVTEKLKKDDEVLALLIGGSIAHGFEKASSDVDIMIIVSEEHYIKRITAGKAHYWEQESCTYEGGYIDGKYISLDFIKKVAECGSEPARFAFDGAVIAYSKLEGLEELLSRITAYPVEKKQENITKFYAQLEAWHWYCCEALRHENEYLLNYSVSNLVLFGGRLILAHNERIYPYHKWFLKVLEGVEFKPENLKELTDKLLKDKNEENIEAFYNTIKNFTDWKVNEYDWPMQFMYDSELNWMEGHTPVADV